MTTKEIKCGSGFYNWAEYREKATQAEIWTENGHRIDGANRGDRHDNGVTVYRPDCVPRTHKGRKLAKLYITVSAEDRETITEIIAHYGHYPEHVDVLHSFGRV